MHTHPKLFYFIPKIQGYSGGSANSSGEHYAPIGSPGNYPGNPQAGYDEANGVGNYNPYYAKNLYDLFYEGNEASLDPPGLFDYSKGRWSAITQDAQVVIWDNGTLTPGTSGYLGNTRKVIMRICGFADRGAGKLIGPDGNEYDTESFLSDLVIVKNNGLGLSNVTPCPVGSGNLLFRVVTQKYGQGIVQPNYTRAQAAWPTEGNGGFYNNVCDVNGCIYIEVDLSCPACPTCGNDTLDGYTGTTITAITENSFFIDYRFVLSINKYNTNQLHVNYSATN